ncbi:MAG: cation:proton antiporter, partial [Chitinophagaceae bacterium]
SAAGQSSFSVLLFQDIAVIPILAILPILAGVQKSQEVISTNPLLAYLQTHSSLTVIAAMLVVFLAGKFLLNPFLYFIAKTRVKELFTASALFIIIGVSIIMTTVGISAALGAFMAGVLLANSEFRHELESNVEPFKGLLLGVFFTAVGSTINFKVLTQQPTMLFTTVAAIMVVKGLVLWLIGKQYKIAKTQNLLFALLLSQAGEFVFVLLGSTQQFGLINKTETDFFMAAVTISMIASPILLFIYEKYIAPRITPVSIEEKEYDVQVDEHNKVIIAGFSHFGSTLGRFLRANNVEATILDNDSDRVNLLRKMGFKVYFGDATRLDLLQAAGAEKAHIVVSTLNDAVANKELAHLIQKHFPHIQLFIRVKNRLEAYEFLEHQIPNVYRETLHTSVYMGVDVLAALGHRRYTATRKANDFIKYDTLSMNKLYKSRNDIDAYISSVREEIEEQEKLLNEDVKFIDKKADNAWDNSALKLA